MTLKVIHRLQAFSSAIRRTFVQVKVIAQGQGHSIHLCSILPDFNWQRTRAVPQRQLGFLSNFYRASCAQHDIPTLPPSVRPSAVRPPSVNPRFHHRVPTLEWFHWFHFGQAWNTVDRYQQLLTIRARCRRRLAGTINNRRSSSRPQPPAHCYKGQGRN